MQTRHTRAQLCDLLWDGPDDPRAELRWSLTKLRPLHDKAHLAYVLNQLASHEDADARGSADLSVRARRTMTQALSPTIDSNDGSNGSAPSLARPSPTHAR